MELVKLNQSDSKRRDFTYFVLVLLSVGFAFLWTLFMKDSAGWALIVGAASTGYTFYDRGLLRVAKRLSSSDNRYLRGLISDVEDLSGYWVGYLQRQEISGDQYSVSEPEAILIRIEQNWLEIGLELFSTLRTSSQATSATYVDRGDRVELHYTYQLTIEDQAAAQRVAKYVPRDSLDRLVALIGMKEESHSLSGKGPVPPGLAQKVVPSKDPGGYGGRCSVTFERFKVGIRREMVMIGEYYSFRNTRGTFRAIPFSAWERDRQIRLEFEGQAGKFLPEDDVLKLEEFSE